MQYKDNKYRTNQQIQQMDIIWSILKCDFFFVNQFSNVMNDWMNELVSNVGSDEAYKEKDGRFNWVHLILFKLNKEQLKTRKLLRNLTIVIVLRTIIIFNFLNYKFINLTFFIVLPFSIKWKLIYLKYKIKRKNI